MQEDNLLRRYVQSTNIPVTPAFPWKDALPYFPGRIVKQLRERYVCFEEFAVMLHHDSSLEQMGQLPRPEHQPGAMDGGRRKPSYGVKEGASESMVR